MLRDGHEMGEEIRELPDVRLVWALLRKLTPIPTSEGPVSSGSVRMAIFLSENTAWQDQ